MLKKKKVHGTHLNQEKFLMNLFLPQLRLLPLKLKTRVIELLLTDFWTTTISDKLSTREQESLLDKLPNKEVDHHLDTGKHHQLLLKLPALPN